MVKSIRLLLAVLFVVVQSGAFAHIAAHGFAEHKHDGKACEVYEYCEHLALGNTPVVAVVLPLLVMAFAVVGVLVGLAFLRAPSFVQPRAPPALA